MRKALADAPEPEDADRQVTGAPDRPRRKVTPAACAHVAVVEREVAHQRERHRERVRRDFTDAVVGRVGDPDAVPRAGRSVDGVEARAVAADDADAGQGAQHPVGDWRVLHEQRVAIAGGIDQLLLGAALRVPELDAGGGEEPLLQLDVRKVEVGDQRLHRAARRRQQSRWWSFTMPVACMKA